MSEDSGQVEPTQANEPAYHSDEKPTDKAELKIFLMPVNPHSERSEHKSTAALAASGEVLTVSRYRRDF